MASNSNARRGFYKARSVSLPSGSHPLALRFEEDLNELKRWIASAPSSSPPSMERIREGLQYLGHVYDAVGNLLRMPRIQTAIGACKRDEWVVEELDFSVKLLDVCSIAREALSSIAENIPSLQSALRTRGVSGEDSTLQERARGYLLCRKDARRSFDKCCAKVLKQMRRNRAAREVAATSDPDLALVVRALKEVRTGSEVVIDLVASKCLKRKSTRWKLGWGKSKNCSSHEMAATSDPELALVVRALQEVRTSAKVVFDQVASTCLKPRSTGRKLGWRKRKNCSSHEMGELDFAIDIFLSSRNSCCGKDFNAGEVQRKLEIAAVGIREVEIGLQGAFKRLINNRVLVLNILNQ